MTPRKVRLVANLLKGLSVNEAEAQLMNMRKRAAPPLLKLLRSAAADVAHNKKQEPQRFFVESVRVDAGPMLSRYLPRARGMATPIQKKMSHVTLVLTEQTTPRPPRFTITVKKKTKLPPGMLPKGKQKKGKHAEPAERSREVKKPGFFRRIFGRKAI